MIELLDLDKHSKIYEVVINPHKSNIPFFCLENLKKLDYIEL